VDTVTEAQMKTMQSENYFRQAQEVMVGGVNSPVRSFQAVGGNPLIMKYGKHSKLFDYDGNSYTDYCLSWGALILGHAHRNVILAAKKIIEKGISFGTSTKEEIDIAHHIVNHVPSIDMIRFVNSGTEATMSAVRLARGFTNKNIVIKFDGCYHGHFDDFLIKAGSGVAQLQESSSQGITPNHIQNTISLPYNDVETFERIIHQNKDDVAGVIIEPVAGNMGVIVAQHHFLKTLRDLTRKYNIILIFDEIMSGFRTHSGCVQTEKDIIPDMTCLGKIIGGGFPVGAFGGRKDIMTKLSPLGGVYQAGTFSGNPIVMKAGLATLKMLSDNFYRELNKKCQEFSQAVNDDFDRLNIDAHLCSYGSMMSLRFRKDPVINYNDAQNASGGKKYGQLFSHFLKEGIYMPPADLEAFFISGMHSKKDLDHLRGALVNFFR